MTYNDKDARSRPRRSAEALRYALNRKGLLGLPAAPIRAYIRTHVGLEALANAVISWILFPVGGTSNWPRPPASPRS